MKIFLTQSSHTIHIPKLAQQQDTILQAPNQISPSNKTMADLTVEVGLLGDFSDKDGLCAELLNVLKCNDINNKT